MTHLTLDASRDAAALAVYMAALARHRGCIKHTAIELGVDRKTASRAVARLGPVEVDGAIYATLREWLDATYPHRNPATVGRHGETRRRIRAS